MDRGTIANWSIRHPVSVSMLSLAVVAVGIFALGKLSVDLLPHVTFPRVRVRAFDPDVPATLMERTVTRPLEQGLAGVDGAADAQSLTTKGSSQIDLRFPYGTNMGVVVRDVNFRLDRIRGQLPSGVETPLVYRVDPARVPVMEFVISSTSRSPEALRAWVQDVFSTQFRSLAGVASTDISGGVEPEIQVIPDSRRLAALGLTLGDIVDTVAKGNGGSPESQLRFSRRANGAATVGRLDSLGAIASLPVRLPGRNGDSIPLSHVARVVATHEEQHVRVRFNGIPGVKLSIRRQPAANTVDVAQRISARLAWLRANGLIPQDIVVKRVSDPAIYVDRALGNAALAIVGGALLALGVVYWFVGTVRGTLIVGTAIPISMLATFIVMVLVGLSLNVMTLGGLALGVGMLIDNTVVMLDNISRHRRASANTTANKAAASAAGEVTGSMVASTSATLAAVLPFLFVGGLVGLLFHGLIFAISVALLLSLVVAVSLVPTLATRMRIDGGGWATRQSNWVLERLQHGYRRQLERVLRAPFRYLFLAIALLILAIAVFLSARQEFLPAMDDGHVRMEIITAPGLTLDEIDARVAAVEKIVWAQGDVASVSSRVGGRPPQQLSNHSVLLVQLRSLRGRHESSAHWVDRFDRTWDRAPMTGVTVLARTRGIREWPTDNGADVDIRVQGPNLQTLARIGQKLVARLRGLRGIRNLRNSAQATRTIFSLNIDRAHAADLGIDAADINRAVRVALDGIVAGQFFAGDRSYNIRVRLPQGDVSAPASLGRVLLRGQRAGHRAIYLRDVASVQQTEVPARILHDQQQRIVKISAQLTGARPLPSVLADVHNRLEGLSLPKGYRLYFSRGDRTLSRGRALLSSLAGLALFLVFVALAVQYESLRVPFVILLSIPFALIGVSIPLLLGRLPFFAPMPVSMSVWLGLILLVGIVVNNAIVLTEYIERMRRQGCSIEQAIHDAARLRLRPIVMTTLTTVCGMIPLALGLGMGAEILQPLALTIIFGLSFSTLVTLLLVPALYRLLVGSEVPTG